MVTLNYITFSFASNSISIFGWFINLEYIEYSISIKQIYSIQLGILLPNHTCNYTNISSNYTTINLIKNIFYSTKSIFKFNYITIFLIKHSDRIIFVRAFGWTWVLSLKLHTLFLSFWKSFGFNYFHYFFFLKNAIVNNDVLQCGRRNEIIIPKDTQRSFYNHQLKYTSTKHK